MVILQKHQSKPKNTCLTLKLVHLFFDILKCKKNSITLVRAYTKMPPPVKNLTVQRQTTYI